MVTSILNKSESWIGITTEAIPMLQDFRNRFMLIFVEALKRGTPSGMVEMDANMLPHKAKKTYICRKINGEIRPK